MTKACYCNQFGHMYEILRF